MNAALVVRRANLPDGRRGIDIAIDDVVVGAPGAPHDEGAGQEQKQMPDVRKRAACGKLAHRLPPPARE